MTSTTATTSSPSTGTSGSSTTRVDCARASQSVWLVKVPKYLADVWDKTDSSGIVGSLRIPLNAAPNNVSFNLAEHLTKVGDLKDVDVPRQHKFIMSDVRQSMGVFSETAPDEDDGKDARDRIAFEGKLAKRADCRPIESANYMLMKRKAIEKACRPTRQVKQIKGIVTTYKPISGYVANSEPEKRKKEEGKRVRAEREDVLEILFSAFEKHQFYTLKDLVGITQQPVVHLKAILRDVCNYNLKNPHKNTYELKPEYRHYKSEEKKEDSDSG